MTHLCIVELIYRHGSERTDKHMEAHREFLQRGYADGVFVASGRKVPRTGGIILARGSRAEVLKLVRQDPFHVHGVADYTEPEFVPTMTSPDLEKLRVHV